MAETKTAAKKPATKKAVKKPVAPKVEAKDQALVLMQNRRGDKMNVPTSKVDQYKDQGYEVV
jgi:hypothetical protein